MDVDRRKFLTWVVAAPALVVAAPTVAQVVGGAGEAEASIPSLPEPEELFDLGDAQNLAAAPTAGLITVVVNADGTASFAMIRTEVGQGIATSTAMLIAEELDLPVSKVRITLADARPELVMNQLTGGSNTTRSTYVAVRTAAAGARQRLLQLAAAKWGVDISLLGTANGTVTGPNGLSIGYATLAAAGGTAVTTLLPVTLKDPGTFTVIGTPQKRLDALAAVTGRKRFTTDLQVPNALPTMICRPPTLLGTVGRVQNLAAVKRMPGVTDVGVVSSGVAVRAATFGQCIDAVRALRVTWNPGPEAVAGRSDADVEKDLIAAELPVATPTLPVLTKTVDLRFFFAFASNAALEPGTAIADVRPTRAEVWSSVKAPIVAQADIAARVGLPLSAVKVHVVTGGGSFGRRLFADAALDAAEASKLFGKPVKLMWHRADDARHGRVHPMSTSRVKATYLAGNVLTYEQRHTSVSTDFRHGFGDILTAAAGRLPIGGNYSLAQSIFLLTASCSYDYGVVSQLLNEIEGGFHTGSMRNIYSPNVRVAQEVVTDQLAKLAGLDPYQFRRRFVQDARLRAVLDKAAKVGRWGRAMPKGTAQGIAVHAEYKSVVATLVEIDCRPATVNRRIYDAYTGPRVTKVVTVADVGQVVNPTGLEAQLQGGAMDGIALTLSSSMHLREGAFLEASWDNYRYTREWNVPGDVQIVLMPSTSGNPGGAGELGVASVAAATACAYGRATGTVPTRFPLNHDTVTFTPYPFVPPVPPSPTDGLAHSF
ncbi:molybdopterin cofactor-binding domain-containing protein [Jatrophihabitans sp. YIM 134969]